MVNEIKLIPWFFKEIEKEKTVFKRHLLMLKI